MDQDETEESLSWSRKDEENQPGDVGWRYRQLHKIDDGLEWAGDRVGDGVNYAEEHPVEAFTTIFGGMF